MSRRGSEKSAAAAKGDVDRTPAAGAPAWRSRLPALPRRGDRRLLGASGLLFLVWLAVLTWLAFR